MNDELYQFLPYQQEKFEEVISKKYANETEKMFYLCAKGHINLLKSLLQDSGEKNPLQDVDKHSILHCAAQHGQFDIVEYLVTLWSEINPKQYIIEVFAPYVNGSGFHNTLFYLCEKGSLDWLKLLLKNLEEENIEDKYIFLHCAVQHDHVHIVEYLLPLWYKNNAKQSITEVFAPKVDGRGLQDTMFYLCEKGSLILLKLMLENVEDKNPGDKAKYTLLHSAVKYGQLNIVEYLATFLDDKNPKAGPRMYDSPVIQDEVTPLHLAAWKGHLSIIEFIVPHLNGNINPAKGDAFTVLHVAACFGHQKVVEFYTRELKKENKNPNPGLTSNDELKGRTPLHVAAQENQLKVVEHFFRGSLLQDKNPCDDLGDTPLHLAASQGHIEIVKYIVEYLDNKHPKSGSCYNYKTPLDYAKEKGRTEVVKFLKNV